MRTLIRKCCLILYAGETTLVQPLFAIVPSGLRSINGSSDVMGCTDPIVSDYNPLNGERIVSCLYDGGGYLTDHHVPTIQMNSTNWAANLVTIKRVRFNSMITFDHSLMTFQFREKVVVTSIYLDLFRCPSSGIGTPYIFVHGSESLHFEYNSRTLEGNSVFIMAHQVAQTNCECEMSTFVVRLHRQRFSVLHILINYLDTPNEWFHVGEVRFTNEPVPWRDLSSPIEVYCESYKPIPG